MKSHKQSKGQRELTALLTFFSGKHPLGALWLRRKRANRLAVLNRKKS